MMMRHWHQLRSPLLILQLTAGSAVFGIPDWSVTSHAKTILPGDAQLICDDSAKIKSWFDPRGFVKPPDNQHFNPRRSQSNSPEDCRFFEASVRMFLWLTSTYARRGNEPIYVLDSPAFFRISLPDDSGLRKLIRNHPTRIIDIDDKSLRSFSPRVSQLGPSNTPVAFDDHGKMHSFVKHVRPKDGVQDACSKIPPIEVPTLEVQPNARLSCPGEIDESARGVVSRAQ
jgi:hypothetical protein